MNMSHNNNQTAAIALPNKDSQAISITSQQEKVLEKILGAVILTVSFLACYFLFIGDPSVIDASFAATSKASLLR